MSSSSSPPITTSTATTATTTVHDDLRARSIPHMTLSTGEPDSMTPPPAPMPEHLTNQERALRRFAVEGNAIFTGGAGTLALVNARALLEHGLSSLALFDLDFAKSTPQIEALKRDFPDRNIIEVTVDVTKGEAVEEAVERTAKAFGGPVGILCCFAGVVGCVHAVGMGEGEWRRVMEVNVTGAFLAARAVARHLIAHRAPGTIVFLASISAHRTNYPQPQSSYNASKAALLSLKSSLAAEWAVHGIRVNSVSPGYMDTVLNEGAGLESARRVWRDRCPMGRMGRAEELEGVVVLLCGRAGSGYVTGADFVVDGGMCCF